MTSLSKVMPVSEVASSAFSEVDLSEEKIHLTRSAFS